MTIVPFTQPPVPITFLDVAPLLDGEDPPVEWLIPDFLPRGSLIALAGEPGTGKSFVTYSLSLAVATGTPFLGFTTTPQRVLYFDQENAYADAIQYFRWAWHGAGCPDPALIHQHLHFAHFQLGGPDWYAKAAAAVMASHPQLIVVDTTTPACHIEDENDNAEATQVITALRHLQAATTPRATIIALKHAKVRAEDGKHTLRGAKAWEGAVDGVLFQTKDNGRPRADGLTRTKLTPAKVRAFGLREPIHINPTWVGDRVGLRLRRSVPGNPGGNLVVENEQ